MKIVKGIFLFALITVLFTSSSLSFVTSGVDRATQAYNSVASIFGSIGRVTEVRREEYFVSKPRFNTAYSSLNSQQRQLYETLSAITSQMPEGFVSLHKYYDGINRDTTIAYNALLFDRAEIFWMPYTYILSQYSRSGEKYTAISFSYNGSVGKTNYTVAPKKKEKMEKELSQLTDSILADTSNLKSEYEKVKYFNDYICENVTYQTEGELLNTAYGALLGGKAHCEGYSRAFKLLCNKAGIECDLICGTSEGEGHLWNSVNIDGIHSFTDVTWNDRSEGKSYQYFNITTAQIEYDHTFAPLHTEITGDVAEKGSFNFVNPIATYTGNSFYKKSGQCLPIEYAERAAQVITTENKKGKNYAELWFESDYARKTFDKDDLGFINSIQIKLKDIEIKSYSLNRDVIVIYW